jgi:hypothetical protein
MIEDIQVKEWFFRNKTYKNTEITRILGVDYIHVKLENNDDIYFAKYGLPIVEYLKPENYLSDKDWFDKNSIRLSGTSCIYKIKTKVINGMYKTLVLKWNRMGQDIPGENDSDELGNAEFNSPFEEFSLVTELRNIIDNSPGKIIIQKPLAIYVPSEHVELSRIGRKEYLMLAKIKKHKEVALDMNRSYAVIYEWIEGIDSTEALKEDIIDKALMESLTVNSEEKIKEKGFSVIDRKPHHIIVRPRKDRNLAKDKDGNIFSALVDFELLERTSEREEMIKKSRRADYLKRQRDRFAVGDDKKYHPHLKHINIFGVDYVYGHVEITRGRLWVVGKDPYLFDYFLPERWEQSPKVKISVFSEMYYTVTKDNIHIVWKISRVGLQPDMDPFREDENDILQYGYNSPFEEISLAMGLTEKGIPTIYPRAVYMTGTETEISANLSDNSRFESHKACLTPEGLPVLDRNHDYITIWGYWNGPDEKLAARDGDYYEGIDALHAYRDGIISQKEYIDLLNIARNRLRKIEIKDLNLGGNHLLLSLDNRGRLIKNSQNIPEIRICNFEFLKKI